MNLDVLMRFCEIVNEDMADGRGTHLRELVVCYKEQFGRE